MLPGQRLTSRYEIVRSLGAGGMGHVFAARDLELERDVAVKLLPPELLADPIARERLRREARAAAALDHPFVCKVFDVGESDGQLFIVMELVVGQSLHDRLAAGPIPLDEVVAIGGEIAEALEAAHDLRLVHRDLKPANVMTTSRGHVKVMDFGLAKSVGSDAGAETQLGATPAAPLTGRSTRVGTPAYMSPEQIAGDVVDHRSDVFSFGVLLVELLTGMHPFSRPTLAGTVAAVLAEPPVVGHARAPEVPSAMRAVLHRMLEKLPQERYQSMGDVRADLHRLRAAPTSTGGFPASAAVGHRGRPQRWPMVGRDAERSELMLRLEDALAGRGALVLIGGEPGIGKTRLTEEVLAEARRRGAFCLVGHCYEGEGAPPYVPFVEITEHTARAVPPAAWRSVLGDSASEVAKLMPELRRMFPDIPPPVEIPAEQQRRFFFNAYRTYVERSCRANPIAVVFEDLHWADEPTLQLLLHVAQGMSSLPLLVIGTYRDVELDVTRPFAKILELLLRQRLATRITLRRLPAEGVADLLTAMSGRPAPASLARAIFKETEGNPFFIEEVFQHLAEEGRLFDASGAWHQDLRVDSLQVPEGVRLVIGRRLERLNDTTRRILTTAAVIGRAFSLTLLEAVEDAAGDAVLDAVEAAERAHLLSPQPGVRESRYVFAHELIRQTLIEALSLPRRQRLHGKVAAAIERVHANALEPHVSALAHHLYQAGAASDPAKTSDCLARAADQARAAAAHEEGLAHLDNALSLWEGEETARVADLMTRRGYALRSLGRLEPAIEMLADAAARWQRLGDDDRAVTVIIDLAGTRLWTMDNETAERELSRALTELTRASAASRSRLHYARATSRYTVGELNASRADIDAGDALRVPGADADLDDTAAALQSHFAWASAEPARSLEYARRAGAAFAARGDLWRQAEIIWTIPWNLFFLGRLDGSMAALAEFEAIAERIGHQGARWVVVHARATHQAARGEIEAALRTAREAETIGRAAGIPWVYHTQSFIGTMSIWQGRDDEGLAILRKTAAYEPVRNYWYPSARSHLFEILTLLAPDEAREWHARDPLALEIEGTLAPCGVWTAVGGLTEAYARLGYRNEVLALAPHVDELRRRGGILHGGWMSTTATVVAITLWHRDRWDEAEAEFRRAIEQVDTIPVFHKRGQPREWYAEMLVARDAPGDRDRARALFAEAREIYAALGFEGLRRRVRTID